MHALTNTQSINALTHAWQEAQEQQHDAAVEDSEVGTVADVVHDGVQVWNLQTHVK